MGLLEDSHVDLLDIFFLLQNANRRFVGNFTHSERLSDERTLDFTQATFTSKRITAPDGAVYECCMGNLMKQGNMRVQISFGASLNIYLWVVKQTATWYDRLFTFSQRCRMCSFKYSVNAYSHMHLKLCGNFKVNIIFTVGCIGKQSS